MTSLYPHLFIQKMVECPNKGAGKRKKEKPIKTTLSLPFQLIRVHTQMYFWNPTEIAIGS